jgi:hypothetical protein
MSAADARPLGTAQTAASSGMVSHPLRKVLPIVEPKDIRVSL